MEPDEVSGRALRIGVIQDYADDKMHLRLYDYNNASDKNRHIAFCGLWRELWHEPRSVDWPAEHVCVVCFAGFRLMPNFMEVERGK